jgi:hypothetical protein
MLRHRISHTTILTLLCLIALSAAGVFWLATAQQPLIDQHEFRQTQTALSALFMQPSLQGILRYETPVVGAPWSIPFEFPLYQAITAMVAAISPWSLSTSGRLVSLAFGLACLAPAWGLMRNFNINRTGRLGFALLYLTSSIYMYWNRAFMIESTALFLTLTSLYFYSEIRRTFDHRNDSASSPAAPANPVPILLGLTASLSLALLVKATTALPSLLLIGLDWLQHIAPELRPTARRDSRFRRLVGVGICLLVAFLMLTAWVRHCDSVKSLNPIGTLLTSGSLGTWNYGTPAQRLSTQLWRDVFIQRMLTPLGAAPAIALILAALLYRPVQPGARQLMLASLALALMPLLAFTNLHIVHNYYQAGNHIFLLIALGSAAGLNLERGPWLRLLTWAMLTLMVTGNILGFTGPGSYLEAARTDSNIKLEIGQLIDQATREDSAIIVYGDDWNSAFAFHSRRRSLTIPQFFRDAPSQPDLLRQPEAWLDGRRLGAVISNQPLEAAALSSLERSCPGHQERRVGDWSLTLCLATPTAGTVP